MVEAWLALQRLRPLLLTRWLFPWVERPGLLSSLSASFTASTLGSGSTQLCIIGKCFAQNYITGLARPRLS